MLLTAAVGARHARPQVAAAAAAQRLPARPCPAAAPRGYVSTAAGDSDFVHGVHSCAAVLQCADRPGGRAIRRVYVARSDAAPARGLEGVLDAVRRRGLRITYTDRNSLNGIVKQQVSQGVAFEVSALRASRVEEPPPRVRADGAPGVLVALDELQDVQNVGAIARSVLLLQADGIVTGVRDAAPLNGTVSRTSSGALEHLAARGQLYETQSLPAFLAACREAGWRVMGAAAQPAAAAAAPAASGTSATRLPLSAAGAPLPADGSATEPRQAAAAAAAAATEGAPRLPPLEWVSSRALSRDQPTVLVLGSESRGLRAAVRRECTAFAYIPMATPHVDAQLSVVDSLNVAAAAAILLHALAPREPLR